MLRLLILDPLVLSLSAYGGVTMPPTILSLLALPSDMRRDRRIGEWKGDWRYFLYLGIGTGERGDDNWRITIGVVIEGERKEEVYWKRCSGICLLLKASESCGRCSGTST